MGKKIENTRDLLSRKFTYLLKNGMPDFGKSACVMLVQNFILEFSHLAL